MRGISYIFQRVVAGVVAVGVEHCAARRMEIQAYAAFQPKGSVKPFVYSAAGGAEPADGEVDLEILYSGVCHSDIFQIDGDWGDSGFPLVAGHEIIGRIVRIGPSQPDSRAHFKVGDVVGIGPQRGSCGSCKPCTVKHEQRCAAMAKTYWGSTLRGGFAHHIRFPSDWTFLIPDGLDLSYAAPLMCAGITVYHPLRRYVLQAESDASDMTVGVVGCGGLGHVAVMMARAMGCTVVVFTRREQKKASAIGFGAHKVVILSDDEDMQAAFSSCDVVINTASGASDLSQILNLATPGGVVVQVGIPPATQPLSVPAGPLVVREVVLSGSLLGSHAEYDEMLAFCALHSILPKCEIVPPSRIEYAVERCRQSEALYRMVIDMQGDVE